MTLSVTLKSMKDADRYKIAQEKKKADLLEGDVFIIATGQIIAMMKARQMSRVSLAKKLGISVNAMTALLSGKKPLSVNILCRIASFLNCTVEISIAKRRLTKQEAEDVKSRRVEGR